MVRVCAEPRACVFVVVHCCCVVPDWVSIDVWIVYACGRAHVNGARPFAEKQRMRAVHDAWRRRWWWLETVAAFRVPDVDEVKTLLLVVLVLVSVLNHSSTPIMEHQGQEAPDNIGQRGDRSGVRSRGSGIAHVRRRGRCREELKERKETAGGRGGEGTSKSDTNIDTQTRT